MGERPDRAGDAAVARRAPDRPILPAMVAADGDAIAARDGTGQADRGRCDVGAVLGEADLLGGGYQVDEPFGDLDLELGREAEADAVAELAAHGMIHVRIAVAEQDRQQRRYEIDVLIAVDVPNAGAIAVRQEVGGAGWELDVRLAQGLRAQRNDGQGARQEL